MSNDDLKAGSAGKVYYAVLGLWLVVSMTAMLINIERDIPLFLIVLGQTVYFPGVLAVWKRYRNRYAGAAAITLGLVTVCAAALCKWGYFAGVYISLKTTLDAIIIIFLVLMGIEVISFRILYNIKRKKAYMQVKAECLAHEEHSLPGTDAGRGWCSPVCCYKANDREYTRTIGRYKMKNAPQIGSFINIWVSRKNPADVYIKHTQLDILCWLLGTILIIAASIYMCRIM